MSEILRSKAQAAHHRDARLRLVAYFARRARGAIADLEVAANPRVPTLVAQRTPSARTRTGERCPADERTRRSGTKTPVPITSFTELERKFGRSISDSFLAHSVLATVVSLNTNLSTWHTRSSLQRRSTAARIGEESVRWRTSPRCRR